MQVDEKEIHDIDGFYLSTSSFVEDLFLFSFSKNSSCLEKTIFLHSLAVIIGYWVLMCELLSYQRFEFYINRILPRAPLSLTY
jgi:hypothetical protein